MSKTENIQYDPAHLKRELTTVQKFNFEIHDEFTLMHVLSRNDGPTALIRLLHMPDNTQQLIDVVKCTFFLHLHPLCEAITMSKPGKRTYTRIQGTESYLRGDALAEFGLGDPSTEKALLQGVTQRGGVHPLAPNTDPKLVPLEWGSGEDGGKRLRSDLVKKTANVFKQF